MHHHLGDPAPTALPRRTDQGVILTPTGRPTRLRDCLLFDLALLGLVTLGAALSVATLGLLGVVSHVPFLAETLTVVGAGACLLAAYVGATTRRGASAEVARLGFADLEDYRSWVIDPDERRLPEPARG